MHCVMSILTQAFSPERPRIQVVEVGVDMETGQITVEKMTDAHDSRGNLSSPGFAISIRRRFMI